MNKFLIMTKSEQVTGWAWFVIQLFFLPVLVTFLNELLHLGLSVAMLNVILFTANFLAVIVIFHRYFSVQLRCVQFTALAIWIPLGWLVYCLLATVVSYVVPILQPDHVNANNDTVSILLKQQPLLMTIGIVFLGPIAEETLYRGLLFGQLYKLHPLLGYIVSTLIFAAVHVVGYIGLQDPFSLLVSLLQYLPAGFAFGFVYVKSKTLIAPIVIHILINALATLVLR